MHYEQMEMPAVCRVDGQLSEGCRNRPSSLFTLAFEIYFCFSSLYFGPMSPLFHAVARAEIDYVSLLLRAFNSPPVSVV